MDDTTFNYFFKFIENLEISLKTVIEIKINC